MALVVGTNSWVTLVEADAYLTNKVGTQDWFSLTDTPTNPGDASKESFLITAFNYLITKAGYVIPSDSTDANVQAAQTEFAYYLFVYGAAYEDRINAQASGVTEFKLSKWSEKYSESSLLDQPLPSIVQNYLSEYYYLNITASITVE